MDKSISQNEIEAHIHSGILADEIIEHTVHNGATNKSKLKLMRISFYDRELKREFEFLPHINEKDYVFLSDINVLKK